MLKHDVKPVVRGEMGIDDLSEKISLIIKNLVQGDRFNVQDFERYFGKDAHSHYLSPPEMDKLTERHKAATSEKERTGYLYSYMNTIFLQATLYYACYKGNLKCVKYLVEEQHMPGDLAVNIQSHLKYLCDAGKKIKCNTLSLSVVSGNLDLVRYVYENTPAMLEVTFGQPIEKTPLMRACETGQEDMIEYLVRHGAHINASNGASGTTPLQLAIRAKKSNAVRVLISLGAIVTNSDVLQAIQLGFDIETIQCLLESSVEKEDPYNPYLMAALKSGTIELLKALEANPMIVPFSVIAKYNDEPLEKRMIFAAAESGQLNMVKYLQDVKKIDVKKYFTEENQDREQALSKDKKNSDMDRIHLTGKTILYAAAIGDARQSQPVLLQYLFEELNARPADCVLKEQCSMSSSMKTVAYLYSFMEEHHAQKDILRSIAFDLESLDLTQLFKLYNSNFIQKGNTYEMHRGRNYASNIELLIKQKLEGLTALEINNLLKDSDAVMGAMFYFCTGEYDKKSEKLMYLLSRHKDDAGVDVVNGKGESLVQYASRQRSYRIVNQLLMRGANPDLPNKKGETLINRVLDFSSENHFEWIQTYASSVVNSLHYCIRRSIGGWDELKALLTFTKGDTQGIPVAELVEEVLKTHGTELKMKALFTYLKTSDAQEMVALLRDDEFIAKNKISKYDLMCCFDAFKRASSDLTPEEAQKRLETKTPSVAVGLVAQGIFRTAGDDTELTSDTTPESVRYV